MYKLALKELCVEKKLKPRLVSLQHEKSAVGLMLIVHSTHSVGSVVEIPLINPLKVVSE